MPDAFLVVMGVRRQIPAFYVLFSFIIIKEVETEILLFFTLKVNIFFLGDACNETLGGSLQYNKK